MKFDFFTIDDDIYPKYLKEIENPPKKLYYKGNLELLKSNRILSVVGTRNPSSYGKLACEHIVKKLIKADITIVSGLASGIDSIAHRVCIDNKKNTIGVIATGLDIVYPASNLRLYEEIERTGLILSEYEVGTRPFKQNFPERNRIIAGLSMGTIIIESKEKGGSLITANLALDYNRDVYAVPGDIFSEYSKGCNKLIRDARAKLLINPEEILDDYCWDCLENDNNKNLKLTENQKKIINVLGRDKGLESIVSETRIEQSEILSELLTLEVMGLIKSLPGGRYKKVMDLV